MGILAVHQRHLAGDVVGAFHKVGHRHHVADALATVGPQPATHQAPPFRA